MTPADIKKQVLILANYVAPEEPLSAADQNRSIAHTVAQVFTGKTLDSASAALIAVELACALDEICS